MRKKTHTLKLPIKARILGILIVVLLLCLAGHLGIFYYTTFHVKEITQAAITEIYEFENKANLELKDSIVNRFVIKDIQTYTDYINRKVKIEKFTVLDETDSDKAYKTSGKNNDKALARVVNLKQVLEFEKYRPGYMFIVNDKGRIIATEGLSDDPAYRHYSLPGNVLVRSENRALVSTAQSILHSDQTSGIIKVTIDDNELFFLFSKITSINCTLVEVIHEEYLNSQVTVIAEKIGAYIKTIRNNFISLYNRINVITLAVFVSIILIAYCIGSSLSKIFTAPLLQLKEATNYIGKGNLFKKIAIHTGDEIEELALNFNLMTDDLQVYIQKLSESISREKAIEEEIKLAAHIQTSSLPESTPSFQPEAGVDLSACIKPTKIVSGDFYDYFFIDDHHLFFAIGDVSGKSISAALFMMTTKILMKRFALMGQSPDEVLKNVNDTLALDNPTCMYSTVFCGVLDTESGHLEYCNGGHTYPLLFNEASFRYLDTEENMLAGLTSKAEFKSETLDLKEHDILFLYSDGVTESKNAAGELYSEQKLLEKLNRADKDTSSSVIREIKEDVLAFSKDAEQYDDITMLCIKFRGKA
ncbi:MAG: SpoIIE family protein phosphatase [Candidatus Xenobiia bacterium LiM19]